MGVFWGGLGDVDLVGFFRWSWLVGLGFSFVYLGFLVLLGWLFCSDEFSMGRFETVFTG